MTKLLRTGSALVLFWAIGGCAASGPSEEAGMIIGGVLGGLLGAQVDDDHGPRTAAIIAGSLLGAQVGASIGRSMDEVDRLRAGQALETVRTGVPSRWRNPDSGVDYVFTPTRTHESASGPCREYSMGAAIGGRDERVDGTACRQADGSWLVQR